MLLKRATICNLTTIEWQRHALTTEPVQSETRQSNKTLWEFGTLLWLYVRLFAVNFIHQFLQIVFYERNLTE